MRFFLVLFIGLSLMTPISGCWDQIELNRASLVTGLALEKGHHKKYKVTFEIVNALETDPNKSGKGGTPTAIYTKEGDSIAEAVSRLNESHERYPILAHIRVIIIDEKLAREGINQFMDVLQRNRYIREDVLILVGKGAPASDFLKIVYARGQYATYKIQTQVETYRQVYGGIPRSHLYDVAQAILSEGRALMLGAISISGEVEKSRTLDAIKTIYPVAIVKLAGAAVFRGDKLIGFLTNDQTRMVMLASDYVNNSVFSLRGKGESPTSPGAVAVQFYHMHSRINVRMNGDQPVFRLHVEGDGKISSTDRNIKLSTIKGYETLEQLTDEYINEEMQKTFRYVQKELGVDVFGFGQHYYRFHFHKYKPLAKEWDDLFKRAVLEASSDFTLRRPDLKTQKVVKENIGP